MVVVGFLVWKFYPRPTTPPIDQRDSISLKLDRLDSTYEENFNIILIQPADSDLEFFTDYLRRFGTDLSGTAETN